ncbi:hypothetical protein niasHT_027900 [Heterodera trifolii]|uniref:Uncharacterized protein n=1 Tax=Heterodera trifolii TaxID=157864 RepID=A0ABD2JDU9_9BILA
MALSPTQALPSSSATIASLTTDGSDTWLYSGFNVGIIILLTCILIILVIVLCLQCRLLYRTRQQLAPCQNSSAVSSAAASSPRTPSSIVPLPIPISVPMRSSSSADHSPPSPIPLQTPSLRHYGQQFLPSTSMPYTADHHRPQVIVPCHSASPYHDHREPSQIGRAVPFSSISDSPPPFSRFFDAHSMLWDFYNYEYMYEYHLSEDPAEIVNLENLLYFF